MADYRVVNPKLTLKDFFEYWWFDCRDQIEFNPKEYDPERMQKVLVYVGDEPFYFIYKRDGAVHFDDGDNLDDYPLNDPEYFSVAGGGKIEFVEEEEATGDEDDVELYYDDEVIINVFFPRGGGWATFLGAIPKEGWDDKTKKEEEI